MFLLKILVVNYMEHEIDLSNFNYNTDIAIESILHNNLKNINNYTKNIDNIKVNEVNVDENNTKIINKKIGKYITIEFEDITDNNNQIKITNILTKELNKIMKIKKDDLILVVGLGNNDSTADSLGPKVVDNIIITNHIYELGLLDKKYKRVCSIKPGVYAKTGIETSNIIESIVKKIKPNLLIVIDSLASGSLNRLNKTIQITDTGINPGSGIGNKRKEISYDTIHIPVIAIGVPTVVSLSNIVYDILNNMDKKFNDNKVKKLLENYDLIVTPTEIDFIIECMSNVIAKSLNKIIKE